MSASRKSNLGVAAAILLALSLGACASKPQSATGDGLGPGGVGTGANAATPGSQQDFVVNVGDRVFFEEDQSTLTAEAQQTLTGQVRWLGSYPRYTVTIEGHADERGTREYNLALGARRAQAVRDYMTAQGIDGSRLKTISYGKERPVAVCNDASCWTQNRRAVTVLNGAAGS